MAEKLPFDWYIRRVDPDAVCPSPSRILGTFAIINAVVSLISVVLGHNTVVRTLTCGVFGSGKGKPWRYMCLLPIALQLGANFLIAHIMKRAHGYDAHYASWELMLFYTARPRMSFVGLALATLLPKKKQAYQQVVGEGGKEGEQPAHQLQPWTSSCIANMIGEVILQLIALYTIGSTVRHGIMNGYYFWGSDEYRSLGHYDHVFYGGALYYLIAAIFFLVVALRSLYKIDIHKNPDDRKICITLAAVILVTTWLGSWLFWAGFVFSAGENYCPPNLISHAIVWSIFSSVGIFFGAGP